MFYYNAVRWALRIFIGLSYGSILIELVGFDWPFPRKGKRNRRSVRAAGMGKGEPGRVNCSRLPVMLMKN